MVGTRDRVRLDMTYDALRSEGPFGSFDEALHVNGSFDAPYRKASDALSRAWELAERGRGLRLGHALDVLDGACRNIGSLICKELRLPSRATTRGDVGGGRGAALAWPLRA